MVFPVAIVLFPLLAIVFQLKSFQPKSGCFVLFDMEEQDAYQAISIYTLTTHTLLSIRNYFVNSLG